MFLTGRFGAADLIELALAAILVILIPIRARIEPLARKLAVRTRWCMLALAGLTAALRLALLPRCPVPAPSGSDDFGYLLLADTLAHFRLANPTHPFHRFFETIFVLQQPKYASIFPLGQGLVLAFGRIVFGHPWAGVLLSVSLIASLCYWMLRAWTTPLWALAGGLLTAIQFGPLNQWTNSYWGGAVAACAGCLVFGSLPRLRERWLSRDAALLGLGLGIHFLTRPSETLPLVLVVVLYFVFTWRVPMAWRTLARAMAIACLAAFPAAALTLLQNQQVTGEWATLPYALSRAQYGVPASFTFQPNPIPHRDLTAAQQLDYAAQSSVHGAGTDTIARYCQRLAVRLPFYRFFFLPPLFLAVPFFLFSLRERRFAWVATAIVVFSLGTNFYPYFYPHYIAAITCLFVLVSVAGLERLSRLRAGGGEAASVLFFLCLAHFLFWYGIHAFGGTDLAMATNRYETWDFINYGDAEGRIAVNEALARSSGRQLVFVRYWPQHRFHEWIHNDADIDAARVVWARDLGPTEDRTLRDYYPDRTVWLLEPDAWPPRLMPYPVGPVLEPVAP